MAGRGPAPKRTRRRDITPGRGDWKPTPGIGWQHGPMPPEPDGLMEASRVAWVTWMSSWVAAHWTPTDLPGLRQLVRIYDQVERGEFQRATELRLGMDTYGLTPKGQQDRRWVAPEEETLEPAGDRPASRYGHLLVVNE